MECFGQIGNGLKALLADHGIYMLFVPPKHSHLNPIEHLWRTIKSRARKLLRSYGLVDVPGAPWLLQEVLNSISHLDIVKYMEHDGYLIEEATLKMLDECYSW
eukprot:scaffold6005_cov198-Pinguiococcus_pyrenoidosus.AAC.2